MQVTALQLTFKRENYHFLLYRERRKFTAQMARTGCGKLLPNFGARKVFSLSNSHTDSHFAVQMKRQDTNDVTHYLEANQASVEKLEMSFKQSESVIFKANVAEAQ